MLMMFKLKPLKIDRLHQKIGLGLSLTGLLILLGTIVLAPSIATLTCERQTAYYSKCKVWGTSLVGLPLRQIRFEPLQGAQPFSTPRSFGLTNRVMLYRPPGQSIPFTQFSDSALTVEQAAAQINTFLGNTELKTFRFVQIVPWQVLLTIGVGTVILIYVGVVLLTLQE